MSSRSILLKEQVSFEQLQGFALKAAELIKPSFQESKSTIVWLQGDLGAGKTTFSKHLLQAFGLAKNVVVQSPTFTYVNEYVIDGHYYAHCDFYRCAKTAFAEELLEYRDFRCVLIEWPDKVTDTPEADFVIDIAKLESAEQRSFTLFGC